MLRAALATGSGSPGKCPKHDSSVCLGFWAIDCSDMIIFNVERQPEHFFSETVMPFAAKQDQ
jgi:hypothetical protein